MSPLKPPRVKDRIVLICHDCGAKHHGEDRYCSRCGRALLTNAESHASHAQASMAGPTRRLRSGVLAASALVAVAGGIALLAGVIRKTAPVAIAGVQIGDTVGQVEKVLGKPTLPPEPMHWESGHTAVLWNYDPDIQAGDVPNLTVTFIDGQVRRVAALDRSFPTADGLRVGDSLSKARSLYGTAIQEDPSGDLVPYKFLKSGLVIKVIVERGDPSLLAIGIETPDDITLTRPVPENRHRQAPAPPPDSAGRGNALPYLGDNGTAL